MKKIGVFTSGGDAPGMNAAIRAVVRYAISKNCEVVGIRHGYQGMINGEFEKLSLRSVANIIQRGGTFLKTARCPDFHKPEVRKKAADLVKSEKIQGLVCIGGDGSFMGAHLIGSENQIPVIGVPGTIDNDIVDTDTTIGFDTAVNTALQAIDRIRDTAASHDRLFIVEVMGRDSGFLAIDVGLAGGAEEIFIPETLNNIDKAIDHVKRGIAKGKLSSILITAEGQKPGRAYDLADAIRKKAGFEAKVCILGHIQRGGSPTAADRILASRLGAAAVKALLEGQSDVMMAIQGSKVVSVPFVNLQTQKKKQPPLELIELAETLSN
ncbi:MAG: 6-phosphofructokinase [Pseudobdellovibrionaceae bacterium]